MDRARRRFLQVAGLSALGLGVKSNLVSADSGDKYQHNPEALHAKRWAMVIDLKKFKESGEEAMKACVQACHMTHNVPQFDNPKDEVKWIWTMEFGHVLPSQEGRHLHDFLEHAMHGLPALAMCNHCDNPPCVQVCPTKATFQRPDGIVMMDYHRCIGCRYCMAGCPFGARSLNWRDPRGKDKDGKPFIENLNKEFPTRTRGVVEKCNFCAERLAVGKMPACVEACKNNEMLFGDMEDPESEVRKALRDNFALRRKPQLGTDPQVYYIV